MLYPRSSQHGVGHALSLLGSCSQQGDVGQSAASLKIHETITKLVVPCLPRNGLNITQYKGDHTFDVQVSSEAAVTQRFKCSPPTKGNRVQFPAGSFPNFFTWESCWTMSLVGGCFRGSPVSPRTCIPFSPHFTLIGS
ncbi:hypothetical protein PR048_025087 [Dryococelus australis]|uniref:Uncharacterized protein n=1 Tax=Dryococelus australis TaxID=614101 RepID=A0ABQ9GQH3_9NEOP|nr:hypothetical protein PR048_025087 [Dryococelus australis]